MFLALVLLFSGLRPSGVFAAIRLLKCHSVNQLPDSGTTEFVFISTKKDDCTFVFEGPEGSKLDIDVRSIGFPKQMPEIDGCKKSKLTVYNYVDSRIILGKFLCNENDKMNVLTKSNMGVITSSITDGSFSLRIRPTLQSQRGTFSNQIDGMSPPETEARDFFFVEHRSNSIDDGFKPIAWTDTEDFKPIAWTRTEDFKPSVPEQPTGSPVHDSYFESSQPVRHYPGRPTAHVDLTANSTGLNFTVVSSRPPRPTRPTPVRPGHSHSRPTTHRPRTTTAAANGTTSGQESTTRPTEVLVTESFRPTVTAGPTDRISTSRKPTANESTEEE